MISREQPKRKATIEDIKEVKDCYVQLMCQVLDELADIKTTLAKMEKKNGKPKNLKRKHNNSNKRKTD